MGSVRWSYFAPFLVACLGKDRRLTSLECVEGDLEELKGWARHVLVEQSLVEDGYCDGVGTSWIGFEWGEWRCPIS